MPQSNLTYKAPYNEALVEKIGRMEDKHFDIAGSAYKPTSMGFRLGSYHGEEPRMIGGGSSTQMYVSSGNSPAYPPMNMHSGMAVSSGGSRFAGVDGAVGGVYSGGAFSGGKKGALFNPFDLGYHIGHDIIGPAIRPDIAREEKRKSGGKKVKGVLGFLKTIGHAAGEPVGLLGQKLAEKEALAALGLGRCGGKLRFGDRFGIGKKVTDLGQKMRKGINKDILREPAGGSLSQEVFKRLMPNPFKSKTGYGRKNKADKFFDQLGKTLAPIASKAVEKNLEKSLKESKKGGGFDKKHTRKSVFSPNFGKFVSKQFGGASCGGAKKPNARAAIVKRVMAERGIGLIEASKAVKAEGLY